MHHTTFIAYDSTTADRIDASSPGIHVCVLGVGPSRSEALRDACRHMGCVVTGLSTGTTADEIAVGDGATRRGHSGSPFVRR